MISSQVLQTAMDELRAITRIDLCVMDLEGKMIAATYRKIPCAISPIPWQTVR